MLCAHHPAYHDFMSHNVKWFDSFQSMGLIRVFQSASLTAWAPDWWPEHGFWPCLQGKHIIVFRFIIEYSSLRDLGP
jgi:hypothetical protein